MVKKVLVVAPHPDDETLGCAGTLLDLKKKGCELQWVIVTHMSREAGYTAAQIETRVKEIEKVRKMIGFDEVVHFHRTPSKIDQVPVNELVTQFSESYNKLKPDTVFLPYQYDVHSDHRYIFQAAIIGVKQFRFPFIKNVFMYETISETDFGGLAGKVFRPQAFSDISKYVDKKIEIMNIYKSEIKKHPFPRSEENIRALATQRGALINTKAAEAFMVVKQMFE
ncbi:MAG: PIG-L family deacetylase [Candidatus Omnitrophica bacterium]|nr:PIG-L family deacetylase [Candidatus Omnitrophota bacterium]